MVLNGALALLSAGGLLQVTGVAFTAWDIQKVREHFGVSQPSWLRIQLRRLWGSTRRIVFHRPPQTVVVPATAAAIGVVGKAELEVTYAAVDQSLPIQDQIALVDERVRNVLAMLGSNVKTLTGADAELKKERATAAAEQKANLHQLDESFTQLATGGLRLRSWSVYLIIFGTIALTIGGALAA